MYESYNIGKNHKAHCTIYLEEPILGYPAHTNSISVISRVQKSRRRKCCNSTQISRSNYCLTSAPCAPLARSPSWCRRLTPVVFARLTSTSLPLRFLVTRLIATSSPDAFGESVILSGWLSLNYVHSGRGYRQSNRTVIFQAGDAHCSAVEGKWPQNRGMADVRGFILCYPGTTNPCDSTQWTDKQQSIT